MATADDPCLIPPSGGYRGLENRFYRVEIHDSGGAQGTATFKWSRDNASVATGISRIEGGTTLTVDRAAWDAVRRFSPGDWVEITDDVREFSGAPGEIRRVATVVDAARTITLAAALPAGVFPVDGQNLTDPARHTRLKRWDQRGLVRDSAGGIFFDLDAAAGGGTGLIPVPGPGTSLILEDGVQVTFTTAPAGGAFRSGDHWDFTARTADASVEVLDAAPPRGVHHHYCRLAVVTFPDAAVDCRTFWPPAVAGDRESCDCTLCVEAEAHNSGAFTIQQAVDQIRATGGTICLGPGIFNLVRGPVRLDGASAVRLRGQGAATVLTLPRGDAAFILRRTQWCTIESLTIRAATADAPAPAIRISDAIGTTIERVFVAPLGGDDGPLAGVFIEPGFLLHSRIRHNFFHARFGVVFTPVASAGGGGGGINVPPTEKGALLLSRFYCEANVLRCATSGVLLGGSSYYFNDTVIARNLISGTTLAGVGITGHALSELDVTDNTITPENGDGILLGCGGGRICGNEIVNLGRGADHGIRLVTGLLKIALATTVIAENRVLGLRGNGIALETLLGAVKIERNVLGTLGGHGIFMAEGSAVGNLSVLGNEIRQVATSTNAESRGQELAGVHLRNVLVGVVADNVLNGIGAEAALAELIAGVRLDVGREMRIGGNTITNVAPSERFAGSAAGVLISGPLQNLLVAANTIRRQLSASAGEADESNWQAIRVLGSGAAEDDGSRRRFGSFRNLSAAGRIRVIHSFAATVPAAAAGVPVPEDAGILGNTLAAYGRRPAVEIVVTGNCRFSDNACTISGQRPASAVDLTAASIIAASNHVRCGPNTIGLHLTVAGKSAYTAVGNITGGPIVVNGGALDTQWQPLNVIVP